MDMKASQNDNRIWNKSYEYETNTDKYNLHNQVISRKVKKVLNC
jgi:hypothetical protein